MIKITHDTKVFFITHYVNELSFMIFSFILEDNELTVNSIELFSKVNFKSDTYKRNKLYISVSQLKIPDGLVIPDAVKKQASMHAKNYLHQFINEVDFGL